MATMLFQIYQDKKRGGTMKYYARAVHPTTLTLSDISERIQRNCSMKKSDVYAVLIEMVEVLKDEISNSNKVLLDGFGYFYNSIQSSGAVTEEEFNATENIQALHTRFLPSAQVDSATGTRTRSTIAEGITYKKILGYRE